MSNPGKGEFHARMEQAEPGLYRALYRGELNPSDAEGGYFEDGPQILPDMHIDTSPAALKLWVEQMARGMGYDSVVWESLPPELSEGPTR